MWKKNKKRRRSIFVPHFPPPNPYLIIITTKIILFSSYSPSSSSIHNCRPPSPSSYLSPINSLFFFSVFKPVSVSFCSVWRCHGKLAEPVLSSLSRVSGPSSIASHFEQPSLSQATSTFLSLLVSLCGFSTHPNSHSLDRNGILQLAVSLVFFPWRYNW